MSAGDIRLSRQELRQFTGTPVVAKQFKMLRDNGIRHYTDAHGRPVVLWSAVEGRPATDEAPTWKPNKAA